MKPITTWYKQNPQNKERYDYSHFTYGHTSVDEPYKLYKNCYLDTSVNPHKVLEHIKETE